MTTNHTLGLLTAAVLAACNAEDAYNNKTNDSEKLPDKTPPAVNLKVHLINGPTYHPTLSVKIDDHDKLIDKYFADESDSEYVLSKDGTASPKSESTNIPKIVGNSSYLKEVILYEDGKPIITRRSTPENEIYSFDYFSVDLEHEDGEYLYEAKAVDNAGNSAESSSLTLVFKDGYACHKENVMKDKTKPTVKLYTDLLINNSLCASIYESEPGDTGILEATLLDGAKVISHYVASQRAGYNKTLDIPLYGYSDNHFCLTNLAHKINSLNFNIPTAETLAAVKDVVVVAKDFAGNETRIAYSETENFKFIRGIVQSYERIEKDTK